MCAQHIFIILFKKEIEKTTYNIFKRKEIKHCVWFTVRVVAQASFGSLQWNVNFFERYEIIQAEMIDGGEFLLETMHRRDYPNHPLWKHMLAIVLFVKARGENQYRVTEHIFNSLGFFSTLFFETCFFNMINWTCVYTSFIEILTLCFFKYKMGMLQYITVS